MGMRALLRIILWGSHLCCCVVCVSVVGLALVREGVRTCGGAARPWQWRSGCPNQHWSNACVRSEDFKKYIIPGEPIVRISLATLAFHPHFAMVSRRSSQALQLSVPLGRRKWLSVSLFSVGRGEIDGGFGEGTAALRMGVCQRRRPYNQ